MLVHLFFMIKDYLNEIQDPKLIFIRFINLIYQIINQINTKITLVITKIAKLIIPKKVRNFLYDLIYLLFKNLNRPRRYLKSNLSIENLFQILKTRNINYVVLRWFENLPEIEKGEDLDILIADEDLSKISDLFVYFPPNNPFDLYSVSGNVGTEFKGMPYYPPHIAKKILETRDSLNGLFSIPNEKYHFLSLAFHAVYHKGKLSGLPSKNNTNPFTSDHDYLSILKKLAKKAGITQLDFTYEGIHKYLNSKGWTPEVDTLRKLSLGDDRIASLLPQQSQDTSVGDGELMVFVIRESALEKNKLDLITKELKEKLDILLIHMLDKKEIEIACKKVRGGKWDKGPYPMDGGKPGCLIICFDYHPTSPSKKDQEKYPNIKNKNLLLKSEIRDKINRDLLPLYHINCIHAADDEVEAWNYIRNVIPQKLDLIKSDVKHRRKSYRTNYPVLHDYYSHHVRSKTELIEFKNKKAIKKTYKLGRKRFLEREIFIFKNFSSKISTIPPLLASQSDYFIIPWYENILENLTNREKRKLIKPHAEEIIDTLKLFYREGFAIVDFHPTNLILTTQMELKIIDFEFLYKYKIKPDSFSESYDIVGIPKNFDGDLYKGFYWKGRTYKTTWQSFLGTLENYLKDD